MILESELLLFCCQVYIATDIRSQNEMINLKNENLKRLLFETDVAIFSMINKIAKYVKSKLRKIINIFDKLRMGKSRVRLAAEFLQTCNTALQMIKALDVSPVVPIDKIREIVGYLAQAKKYFHDYEATKAVIDVYKEKRDMNMTDLYESHNEALEVSSNIF